jgi:hypothetical protein
LTSNRSRRGRALLALLAFAAGATTSLAGAAETYWPPITDHTTGQQNPGRFVWAELLTRDVGTAAEFYGKVFGWTFETYGPADDLKTYTVVLSGGVPIGGMVYASPKDDDKKRHGARWVGLMSVPDVQAAAARVERDGGKVLMPPRTLGGRGTVALFLDPEGGLFGVINSATGDPEDYLADENQWLWIELRANDPAKMAEFYKGIGAYEIVGGAVAGESSGFRLKSGGYARAGIQTKLDQKNPTTWVPYLRVKSVADTVARASAAGARIVMQPTRMHGTAVAVIVDPTGAPVAVAEWPATGKEAT